MTTDTIDDVDQLRAELEKARAALKSANHEAQARRLQLQEWKELCAALGVEPTADAMAAFIAGGLD